jgi:hypothetical protein
MTMIATITMMAMTMMLILLPARSAATSGRK